MASLKTCFKCGQAKPKAEFYKHSAMGDGYLGKCKVCTRRDSGATRAARIGYYRAYDRTRAVLPHRVKQARIIGARWRTQFPNRKRAQMMLGNALRSGKVIPLPCLICGEKAEAHHPDYSMPLDVVWLCSPHHKQAHALVKKVA